MRSEVRAAALVLAGAAAAFCADIPKFEPAPGPLVLSGKVNPWRFINAVGEKSGLWGYESGRLESWVYPLKILHDFHLEFQLPGSGRIYSGDEIVRSVRVYPHMVRLQYAAEQFAVEQILFTPRTEPGSLMLLDVRAPGPLRIFARFRTDLNLMWPGSVGGQTVAWEPEKKWLRLSEPSGRFSALIGSPAATGSTATGYHSYVTPERPYEALELEAAPDYAKRNFIPIAISAGIRDAYDAEASYTKLLSDVRGLFESSLHHYSDLDAKGTEFITPDREVNDALRWSRVALDQLKVCNPQLGCSYVSGYGSSGTGTRPMYAWFFDEPTVTSWAYLQYGGVESVKEAFRFIQKYQRADGKIPHEVSQSAAYIDWFKDYPYAYIHPDSPLWYLIAIGHFYRFTGDDAFLKESWPSIRKAYSYAVSLVDASDGLPAIPQGEWGSMENAAFTKDSAMAGEWIAALRGFRELSERFGEPGLAAEASKREKQAAESLEKRFWNPDTQFYNYGVDVSGKPATHLNPTIGWSAWFGSLPEERAKAVLERLSTAMFLSDWGQRNMSLDDPRYTEGSYQVGSVWPFMTAGPMLAQFRYHNAVQGFMTWMDMIRLRWFNARGAMPEVLSGTVFRLLDNAVPHQMFSETNIIPGLVNGVMGLELDVPRRRIRLAPHMPPGWPECGVRRFPFGQARMRVQLTQGRGELKAVIETPGAVTVEFSPALPAGSKVLGVTQDGQPVKFEAAANESDVHANAIVKVNGKAEIAVNFQPGLAVEVEHVPLLEGDSSANLRVVRSVYREETLELTVEGRPERTYRLRVFGPGEPRSVETSAPADRRNQLDRAGYARWTVRVR